MVSFWQDGEDGELDSREVPGIGERRARRPPRRPNRSPCARTSATSSPGARTELFNNRNFKDSTAKIFAKRRGRIVPPRRIQARSPDVSAIAFASPPRCRSSLRERLRRQIAGSDGGIATLERRLGPLDAAAIVVSNVIGGGIFFVPVIVAQLVPSAWAMLGVWLFGGLLAFAGAMAYAELATLRPRAGGEYVYLRDAYGQLAAFLSGWTSFVAGFSGAIAAGAVALGRLPRPLHPGRGRSARRSSRCRSRTCRSTVTPQALVAITRHRRAVDDPPPRVRAALVHNLLAGAEGVGAASCSSRSGCRSVPESSGNLRARSPVGAPATGWLLALMPVMFSYSGWNAAAYVAEEIRDPGSQRAAVARRSARWRVVVVYLALNVLYLLRAADHGAGGAGRRAAHRYGRRAAVRLRRRQRARRSSRSSASRPASARWCWPGPRVYYAMARDGCSCRRPAACIRGTARRCSRSSRRRCGASCWCCRARWQDLVAYTGFAVVLFAGIAVLAAVRAAPSRARTPIGRFRRSAIRSRPPCSSWRARPWSSTRSGTTPARRWPGCS